MRLPLLLFYALIAWFSCSSLSTIAHWICAGGCSRHSRVTVPLIFEAKGWDAAGPALDGAPPGLQISLYFSHCHRRHEAVVGMRCTAVWYSRLPSLYVTPWVAGPLPAYRPAGSSSSSDQLIHQLQVGWFFRTAQPADSDEQIDWFILTGQPADSDEQIGWLFWTGQLVLFWSDSLILTVFKQNQLIIKNLSADPNKHVKHTSFFFQQTRKGDSYKPAFSN